MRLTSTGVDGLVAAVEIERPGGATRDPFFARRLGRRSCPAEYYVTGRATRVFVLGWTDRVDGRARKTIIQNGRA